MKITNEGWAIVDRDTHLGRWVEEHKRLDFDQNALPQMLPYIKPGSVVLDIGANIGCYAYAFSKIATNVICFEPNTEIFKCLKFNFRNMPSVVCFNNAISDGRYCYDSVCDNDNLGMSYIVKNEQSGNSSYALDDTEVLNAMVSKTMSDDFDISFIKIDVEGYELKVLKGAEKTISIHKPVMVIEINDHTLKRTNTTREEIFQWLTDHGYTYRNIYAEQGLQDDQLDIICFPT